ncbi:hypothetical protein CsatA_002438 [Cannabis sativa]
MVTSYYLNQIKIIVLMEMETAYLLCPFMIPIPRAAGFLPWYLCRGYLSELRHNIFILSLLINFLPPTFYSSDFLICIMDFYFRFLYIGFVGMSDLYLPTYKLNVFYPWC